MSKPATIANSDIVGAWAANMSRAIAHRLELDVKALEGPKPGQVWCQIKGEKIGRRALVTQVVPPTQPDSFVRLYLGSTMRQTRLQYRRFIKAWQLEVEA
jgi:hypothetical protein